ncbi:hypothetical protein INR49_020423 [Caranx melampygus]|nr:hypothetical protein INR49_020423 [Caranx melampygus]
MSREPRGCVRSDGMSTNKLRDTTFSFVSPSSAFRGLGSTVRSHQAEEEEEEEEESGERPAVCCYTTGAVISQDAEAQWSMSNPSVHSGICCSSGMAGRGPGAPPLEQPVIVCDQGDLSQQVVGGCCWEGPLIDTQGCVCVYGQREPEALGPCWPGSPYVYYGLRTNVVVGVEVVEEVAVEDTVEIIDEARPQSHKHMEDSPPTTTEGRLEFLKELTEFTENCRKQLNEIYETLGWSPEYKQEAMEQCPYDPDHIVPVRSMEKHKASCQLRQMGYTAEEQAEMCDPSVCYENTNIRSFTMDKSTQHQVILQARSAAPLMRMEGVFWQGQYSGQPVDVPQSHKRAVCDLTVADRLALYDHVVGVLGQQKEAASSGNEDLYVDLVSKLQKDDEQNEPKTHLELMAEMRDYKRRRQSYRAKNVHITKKSYTEVIREVISVHSEELARQWREDEEESTRSEPSSSHRRRVDERRSASSESRHGHSSRRHHSRERSHDRESKKKKRKRERDSRSPSEHHHDRKKKKKKKKDDREREKEK